jgi:hypothetical protein
MRIRVQLPTMTRIHADPDPQHWIYYRTLYVRKIFTLDNEGKTIKLLIKDICVTFYSLFVLWMRRYFGSELSHPQLINIDNIKLDVLSQTLD